LSTFFDHFSQSTVIVPSHKVPNVNVKSTKLDTTPEAERSSGKVGAGDDGFRTDSQISGGRGIDRGLVKAGPTWTSAGDGGVGLGGDAPVTTMTSAEAGRKGADALNWRAAAARGGRSQAVYRRRWRGGEWPQGRGGGLDGSIGDWDQFSANEKKFNVKASFDENLYTTKLDLSSIDASQRAVAERIAKEIESTSSTNMHVAEERNQAIGNDYDEEDRYSGVLTKDLKARPIVRLTAAAAPAVSGFDEKKKTTTTNNDDLPSDVIGKSPTSSSTTKATSTTTTSKAGPAEVAQGPKGGGGSSPDGGKKQTAGKEEDDDADATEYAERQARMRRLSDKRRASDEAESRLRAEREALDPLVAEQDARQATIDRLRSAEEMAVRERLGMKRDESSRLAELEGVQEDAERARILSVERERMIRLDMQLARVEAMALEERIETIRDQVRRLEGEQDRTRAMLEVRMKTATVTASTVTSSTPSSSSSPALRMADVKKAVATADAGKRSPSYTATTAGPVVKATMSSSPLVPSSSRSLFDVVSADGPSPLGTAYAAGALVLGAGAGAVLFLNKEDEDDDNKARGDEGPSSSPPSTMSSDRSSSSSSASLDDAAKYDERSGGGPSSSSSFGAYGGRGGDDGTAQTAPTSVSREDRYSRTIIDRSSARNRRSGRCHPRDSAVRPRDRRRARLRGRARRAALSGAASEGAAR
jgi:hypothetical protein